jgi:hypothetical protein
MRAIELGIGDDGSTNSESEFAPFCVENDIEFLSGSLHSSCQRFRIDIPRSGAPQTIRNIVVPSIRAAAGRRDRLLHASALFHP